MSDMAVRDDSKEIYCSQDDMKSVRAYIIADGASLGIVVGGNGIVMPFAQWHDAAVHQHFLPVSESDAWAILRPRITGYGADHGDGHFDDGCERCALIAELDAALTTPHAESELEMAGSGGLK